MAYYKVIAKCGHVRRNNYIFKNLYIKASNKKEAAAKARNYPRVKHHHKDAIRDVIEITFEEYCKGLKSNKNDKFFQVHNSTDQRRYDCVDIKDVFPEEEKTKYKKKRQGQILRNIIQAKEMNKEIRNRNY